MFVVLLIVKIGTFLLTTVQTFGKITHFISFFGLRDVIIIQTISIVQKNFLYPEMERNDLLTWFLKKAPKRYSAYGPEEN